MSRPLEEYGIIGDTETAALISRGGSLDWLCLPRFDSPACFAALLGDESHGHWVLAPTGDITATRRRYLPGTLVLETEHDTATGTIRVTDAMPPRAARPGPNADVLRVVEGVTGQVTVETRLVIRFDYGSVVPWVTRTDHGLQAVGGPDAVTLTTPVALHGDGLTTVARFDIHEGERVPLLLTWFASHEPPPPPIDVDRALDATVAWWREWVGRCHDAGPWTALVERSLITLKALTYAPSGGIAAAATTSLPEQLGGKRNWDYRYTWLRDATFTLDALLSAGFVEEARAWRDWLLRAVAGDPHRLQIMYDLRGGRRLDEVELGWLPGYEGSRPVRVGNAAYAQQQLDVYGEVMDALHLARMAGLEPDERVWDLQRLMLDHLADTWDQPDHSLWEIRGEPREFTHSRVMSWVAFDRAVMAVEQEGLDGPVEHWREVRDTIHAQVCAHGYDPERNTFVQSYGSREVDAALLLIAAVGFVAPDDPRMLGTIDAIEADLLVDDAFVLRYRTEAGVDGLSGREGSFLICGFWLVDALALAGRHEEARRGFARLTACATDLGLLAEEYDHDRGRLVGNFPQAFSHIGLVNSAFNLASTAGPVHQRARGQRQRSTT